MDTKTLDNILIIGNRIPKDFFITTGTGESDITVHAGSYHLALQAAGVERYNHMTYSSILPRIAREVPQPKQYEHGAVLETIAAVAHVDKKYDGEERAAAGIIYGWLLDRKTEEKQGGLVCEYNGHDPIEIAEQSLRASLQEIYQHGFEEDCLLRGIKFIGKSFVPQKNYGTAVVMLGFVNYVVPILEPVRR